MVRTAYFIQKEIPQIMFNIISIVFKCCKILSVRLIGHFPSSHHEFHRKSDRIIESAVICYH